MGKSVIDAVLGAWLWCKGWRRDLDGWLVRARRESDPATLPPEIGFVEEAGIAVRTIDDAWSIEDRRFSTVHRKAGSAR